MQRITITIDDDLLDAVDAEAARRGYESRSEALREIVRGHVRETAAEDEAAPCVAVLSCICDHATRDVASRMARTRHDHHDLTVSTLNVQINHDSGLEVSVLRGPIGPVRRLADELTAQRGVRHAHLHLAPAEETTDRHDHGAGHGAGPHRHIRA